MEEVGDPSLVLMEAAAKTVVDCIIMRINKENPILVLAGGGNNGGDAITVTRMLHTLNYQVTLLVTAPIDSRTPANQQQLP